MTSEYVSSNNNKNGDCNDHKTAVEILFIIPHIQTLLTTLPAAVPEAIHRRPERRRARLTTG